MCGIIAAFNFGNNKENVNKDVVNQLEDQISRGQSGFGITTIDEKNIVKTERATELTKALLDLRFNLSKMIIMHHRTPTSSENKISQTQAILVSNGSLKYNYLVCHNGMIQNDLEMRKKHMDELGFVYTTDRIKNRWGTQPEEEFNDSESLAIELARFIEKQTDKIEAVGCAAFVVLQTEKETNKAKSIFFGRNSNPLIMSKSRNKMRLSSEGEGSPIQEDIMYECNLKDFKLKKQKCKIETSKHTTTYNDEYDDYGYYGKNYRGYGLTKLGEKTAIGYNEHPTGIDDDWDTTLQEKLFETSSESQTDCETSIESFWDVAEQMITQGDGEGMENFAIEIGNEIGSKLATAFQKLKVEAAKIQIATESAIKEEEKLNATSLPDKRGDNEKSSTSKWQTSVGATKLA